MSILKRKGKSHKSKITQGKTTTKKKVKPSKQEDMKWSTNIGHEFVSLPVPSF